MKSYLTLECKKHDHFTARDRVIISGGGPVGLTLANLLGQAQIGVIILEKNDSPLISPGP